MQQHGSKYFAHRHPQSWGWGQYVKIQLFQNMVMLQINLKGIKKCSSKVANILPGDTYPHPPDSGNEVSRQKLKFSEHGHVAYQN